MLHSSCLFNADLLSRVMCKNRACRAAELILSSFPRLRHPFTPAKLCTAVDEAKVHAAEHALQILGLQTEGAEVSAAAAAVAAAFPGMLRSVKLIP